MPNKPILEVDNLSVSFLTYAGMFRREKLEMIRGLSLTVDRGTITAVIGSSGSGKSLLAHAILGVLPSNARITGTIRFAGEQLTEDALSRLRGREISLIPQSVNYLDPLMTAGAQVRSAVRSGNPREAQRKAFERYKLPPETERRYPHQLSGGMARRVLVSMAAVSGASLVIADEPTVGLDPAAARMPCIICELADEGAAVLLITHDIEAALGLCDKAAVFYAGSIVEHAQASDFSGDGGRLRHPYSKALWQALPQNGFTPTAGRQPLPKDRIAGCLFASRCVYATDECRAVIPDMRS